MKLFLQAIAQHALLICSNILIYSGLVVLTPEAIREIGPTVYTCMRMVMLGFTLFPLASLLHWQTRFNNQSHPIWSRCPDMKTTLFLGGCGITMYISVLLYMHAFSRLPSVAIGIIQPMTISFTYFFSVIFRRERARFVVGSGVLLAILGALTSVIVVWKVPQTASTDTWVWLTGIGAHLISVILWGLFLNLQKTVLTISTAPTLLLTGWITMIAGIVSLIPTLFVVSNTPIAVNWTTRVIIGLLYGGLVHGTVNYICLGLAAKLGSPTVMSMYGAFTPVVAPVSLWLFKGETFPWWLLLVAIPIIFGVCLVSVGSYKMQPLFESTNQRIQGYIQKTPVVQIEDGLYAKCEHLNRTGSFKIRGAANAILKAHQDNPQLSICTHSSGNHGQAIASICKQLGRPCHIIVPVTIPTAKLEAIQSHGANIYQSGPTSHERQQRCREIQEETKSLFIHSSDHDDVIMGQGTIILELIDQLHLELDPLSGKYKGLSCVICPVGGGGLLAGVALYAQELLLGCRVVGAEPATAMDAYLSLLVGERRTLKDPLDTVCDGLKTSLSDRTWKIIHHHVDEIIPILDSDTLEAQQWLHLHNFPVETNAAIALAAYWKMDVKPEKTVLVLSGGNIN